MPVYDTSSRQLLILDMMSDSECSISLVILHHFSSEVEKFMFWEGLPKTITSHLEISFYAKAWASPHMLHSMQISPLRLRLALNQSLKSDKISGRYHLTSALGEIFSADIFHRV